MKSRIITMGLAALATGALVADVRADRDDRRRRGPDRQIVSAAAVLPEGQSQSVALLTVPEDRRFLLTQACVRNALGDGLAQIVGSTLGRLPMPETACETYTPGVVFEGGETLSCDSVDRDGLAGGADCLITGRLR